MVLFDVQDTAVFSLVPLSVAWTHDLRCLSAFYATGLKKI